MTGAMFVPFLTQTALVDAKADLSMHKDTARDVSYRPSLMSVELGTTDMLSQKSHMHALRCKSSTGLAGAPGAWKLIRGSSSQLRDADGSVRNGTMSDKRTSSGRIRANVVDMTNAENRMGGLPPQASPMKPKCAASPARPPTELQDTRYDAKQVRRIAAGSCCHLSRGID